MVVIGENVGFGDRHIASVVGDVLLAGKRAGFGISGRTTGDNYTA